MHSLLRPNIPPLLEDQDLVGTTRSFMIEVIHKARTNYKFDNVALILDLPNGNGWVLELIEEVIVISPKGEIKSYEFEFSNSPLAYTTEKNEVFYIDENGNQTFNENEVAEEPEIGIFEDYTFRIFPHDKTNFSCDGDGEIFSLILGEKNGLILIHNETKKFRIIPFTEPYESYMMARDGNTILFAKKLDENEYKFFIIDNPFAELT